MLNILPGSPAETAGVRLNDIILSIANQPIDAVPAMLAVSFQHPPGDCLQMKVLRGDQELEVVHGSHHIARNGRGRTHRYFAYG